MLALILRDGSQRKVRGIGLFLAERRHLILLHFLESVCFVPFAYILLFEKNIRDPQYSSTKCYFFGKVHEYSSLCFICPLYWFFGRQDSLQNCRFVFFYFLFFNLLHGLKEPKVASSLLGTKTGCRMSQQSRLILAFTSSTPALACLP
jgi:hypothetical protein